MESALHKSLQISPMRTGCSSHLGSGTEGCPGDPLQILPLAGTLTRDIIGHVLHMQISKYKISYELLLPPRLILLDTNTKHPKRLLRCQ